MARTDLTRDDQISRLRDLSLCLNNRDDICIEQQVRNLLDGRAAYWFRGRSSGASWVVALSACEEHNSFLKALEVFAERHPGTPVLEILDAVIPLNAEAVHELGLCYRLQSTFRDDAELIDRERQAIFEPEFMPRDPDMRARWMADYEACQRRFEARQGGVLKTSPAAALALSLAAVAADDVARVAVEGERLDEVA